MHSSDDLLAHSLAEEAGRRLLELRGAFGFDNARELRNAGDRLAHDYLTEELSRERPHDAVLSEEGADNPDRLQAERVWIIDPLDGTREFAEAGRDDWAVHVALWQSGALVAGAVALPARGFTLSTLQAGRRPTRTSREPRIVVSRTRAPDFVAQVATRMGAELVPMGSAGAKAAAVVLGEADAYLHAGGQYEWDSAAPAAVATAAGVVATRLDGSELRYNQPHPYLPDLLVCRADLVDALLTAVSTGDRVGQG